MTGNPWTLGPLYLVLEKCFNSFLFFIFYLRYHQLRHREVVLSLSRLLLILLLYLLLWTEL